MVVHQIPVQQVVDLPALARTGSSPTPCALASDTTIVAIATPSAPSGIGIVRLSGPDAVSVGQAIFRPSGSSPLGARVRQVQVGTILGSNGEDVDLGLAWVFSAPKSYTGEDTVELSCHGSLMVLEAVVRAALANGAVLAEPGEFTRRAFLNGKIDLVQAEAVADLIHASGQFSLGNAYGLLQGQLSARIKGIAQLVVRALAHTEALLDFPEDVAGALGVAQDLVAAAHGQCAELTSTFSTFSRRSTGVEVAIIGPPNAGKSSLFNLLLKESRAIVSPVPGTTRDLIEARLFVDGELFRLLDTAGLRASVDPVEVEGVNRAYTAAQRADLVLLVLDASLPRQPDIGALLGQAGTGRGLVVFNKSDLPRQLSLPTAASSFPSVLVSALTGEGLGPILDFLRRNRVSVGSDQQSLVLTRLRHFECLSRAESLLQSVLCQYRTEVPALECIAEELRGALDEIYSVLGVKVNEDVLDLIFSEFCIGK